MEIIKSRANDRVKNIIKLISSKKDRDIQGLFVIEGIKLVEEAQKNNIEFRDIFCTEEYLKNNKNRLEFLLNSRSNVSIITQNIADKISKNKSAQGIFCVCKMKSVISLETIFKSENNKVLLLFNLQDPGNIGTIIRCADAFGIKFVILTSDCCDIYNFKTLRSAMGSIFRVNVVVVSEPINTIIKFKQLGFVTYASILDENSIDIDNVCFSEKSLMIVGNEGHGLNNEIMDVCDKSVKIPISKNVDSLNVAMASSILMWKMTK